MHNDQLLLCGVALPLVVQEVFPALEASCVILVRTVVFFKYQCKFDLEAYAAGSSVQVQALDIWLRICTMAIADI